MAYKRQTFINDETVMAAEHLEHIEAGIVANEKAIEEKQPKGNYLTEHQKLKTINGQSLVGEGDIDGLATEGFVAQYTDHSFDGESERPQSGKAVMDAFVEAGLFTHEFEDITNTLTMQNGFYVKDTGAVEANEGFRATNEIACHEGDVFRVHGKTQMRTTLIATFDEEGNVVESAIQTANAWRDVEYTCTENDKYIAFSSQYPDTFTNTQFFKVERRGIVNAYDKIMADVADKVKLVKYFVGKNGYCFGDSITAGVSGGGYIKYIAEKTGATLKNYGVAGYHSYEMLKCLTGGRYGYANGEIATCDDYTNCSFVTIMIGTNGGVPSDWEASFDSLPQMQYGHQIKDIPFTVGENTVANTDDYYALFPNNIVGHLAFAVEWIRYKNPNTKVFLIPPTPTSNSTMQDMKDMYIAIGKRYGVQVVNALDNCGMNIQNFGDYSGDGVHLNADGNLLWGKYIGNFINEYGKVCE